MSRDNLIIIVFACQHSVGYMLTEYQPTTMHKSNITGSGPMLQALYYKVLKFKPNSNFGKFYAGVHISGLGREKRKTEDDECSASVDQMRLCRIW
jgi:hypothetical protein